MSNLLELLSLNELNIRRENLLKQISKVELEIKKRNKESTKNLNKVFPEINLQKIEDPPENIFHKGVINTISLKSDPALKPDPIKKKIKIIVKKNSAAPDMDKST